MRVRECARPLRHIATRIAPGLACDGAPPTRELVEIEHAAGAGCVCARRMHVCGYCGCGGGGLKLVCDKLNAVWGRYAVSTPEETRELIAIARATGVMFDPVYAAPRAPPA